jgi:hypothetical protein
MLQDGEIDQWRAQKFCWGGVQPMQLRTEDRQNGDLGAVEPQRGVPLNLQMSDTIILIRLLRMYIPRNWEFSSALSKLLDFCGVVEIQKTPSVRH